MTLRMNQAAPRAESMIGDPTPHGEAGWCLEWNVVDVYGIPAPWTFVNAYGVRTNQAWAINYWYAAKKYGKVVLTSNPAIIPRGAMTFSKGKSKYGHVWNTSGDSQGVGTDYPRTRRIGSFEIPNLLTAWGHKLLGYIEITGDGQDLRSVQTTTEARMDPDNYYLGARGDHVTWLGERLIAHGYRRTAAYKPGPTFTTADQKAVQWFQRSQGWSGAGADGFPGHETLKRLAA